MPAGLTEKGFLVMLCKLPDRCNKAISSVCFAPAAVLTYLSPVCETGDSTLSMDTDDTELEWIRMKTQASTPDFHDVSSRWGMKLGSNCCKQRAQLLTYELVQLFCKSKIQSCSLLAFVQSCCHNGFLLHTTMLLPHM